MCYVWHVLESSKASTDSVLFFTPSTQSQRLHKLETRPLTVVEYLYRKVEYIQLIFLTFSESTTR